ncbi:hypothetical protein [Oceanicella actignis]|uniref:Uncharacterized protein n=1 Tax=Oceanicella actignis TaxID=1189325 RepID=A0A1M7TND6_9RHOB|nr:hypothetical protein [Oceanicella actignis]SET72085.1 hypothetical protein SAMN04488119_10836 [Oceanicella actignis]SHN72133.1 hypothetical protein SAMN05216200_10837 [Oceanicella actignis]
MRMSATILTVVAACAAVWAQASGPASGRRGASAQDLELAVQELAGLRARLGRDAAAAGLVAIEDMVLGRVAPEDAARVTFRARALRAADGAAAGAGAIGAPIYGQATRLCDARADDPECWRITLLEIDGRPAPVPGSAQ